MSAVARQKIQDMLAAHDARVSGTIPAPQAPTPAPVKAQSVSDLVEKLLAGEKTYTISQVMEKTGYSYNTISRRLKGKPGWLRNSEDGGIRITETLLRSFLTDLVSTGLKDAGPL